MKYGKGLGLNKCTLLPTPFQTILYCLFVVVFWCDVLLGLFLRCLIYDFWYVKYISSFIHFYLEESFRDWSSGDELCCVYHIQETFLVLMSLYCCLVYLYVAWMCFFFIFHSWLQIKFPLWDNKVTELNWLHTTALRWFYCFRFSL